MRLGRLSRRNRVPTRPRISPDVIDRLMEMYLDWREECASLGAAYERWLSVPIEQRNLAFAAYRAALDREEQASAVYAKHLNEVAHPAP
jgi:hypothetical protein